MVENIFNRLLSLVQKESKRPKMYFSLKLNTFAFFTTLRKFVKNSNSCEGTHVFVLNLLVRLPVVRVQLDALRQLALDDLPLLRFLIAC